MCPHGDWDRRRHCQLAGCAGNAMNWEAGVGTAEMSGSCKAMSNRIWTLFRSWKQGGLVMVPRSEKGVVMGCK